MYRSIMEGIAYEYSFYFNILKKLYPATEFRHMFTIGGGAKSDLFNSIKADVLGVPVTTFEMENTALAGSAVIAGYGAGVLDDYKKPIKKITRHGKTFEPDGDSNQVYKKYAEQYLNVIDALRDIYRSELYKVDKE